MLSTALRLTNTAAMFVRGQAKLDQEGMLLIFTFLCILGRHPSQGHSPGQSHLEARNQDHLFAWQNLLHPLQDAESEKGKDQKETVIEKGTGQGLCNYFSN